MRIALVACHLDLDASCGLSCQPRSPGDQRYAAEQAAHLQGLGQALAGRGHRVTVYARRHATTLPETAALGRGLTMRYLPAGPAEPMPAAELPSHLGAFGSQLARWLRQKTPDVVHAYHWTGGLAALAAARSHDVPVVQSFGSLGVTERRGGVRGPQDDRRRRMEAGLGRAAAGVLAATSAEAADLGRLGVPGSRVRVVPPGVDPARFGQGKAAWRHGEHQRLLYVGSLDADQRVDVPIRALAEVAGAELVVASRPGATAADYDAACKRLGKLAAELGVADRVIFAGQAGDAELHGLLRSASLLVSAAVYEPLGVTAVSAMAAGLPVVATGVGAHQDAVIDGTTGALIPASRPELLGRVLRDLLAAPARLGAYGIAAADRAASRYSWARIGAEAEAAYQHFLSRPAEPSARRTGSSAEVARRLAA